MSSSWYISVEQFKRLQLATQWCSSNSFLFLEAFNIRARNGNSTSDCSVVYVTLMSYTLKVFHIR
jgi:hypothetical protein